MSDLLVRVFGWSATLIHGDTSVLDRWQYLRPRLPRTRVSGERLLEVGCGTGAFCLGAARRGYQVVGLSWDMRNQEAAQRRACIAGINSVEFPICDVRHLDQRSELVDKFDIVVCFETIEHIIDDRKLMRDMYRCLKPGGRLYLTTPNYYYHPLAKGEMGPFSIIEDGWHVRRGYTPAMLRELCAEAGFMEEEITHITHYLSQRITQLQSAVTRWLGHLAAWLVMLPMRPLPLLLDGWLGRWLGPRIGWPGYCIALSAYKPRFAAAGATPVYEQRQTDIVYSHMAQKAVS